MKYIDQPWIAKFSDEAEAQEIHYYNPPDVCEVLTERPDEASLFTNKQFPTHQRFSVEYQARPSIRRLVARLIDKCQDGLPVPFSVPVVLLVEYKIAKPEHLSEKKFLWHLRAPSMAAVVQLCAEALVSKKLLSQGQIVDVAGSKVAINDNDGRPSSLNISIETLDSACNPTLYTREQRLLVWLIERCRETGKEPTWAAYRSMLKNLAKKNLNKTTEGLAQPDKAGVLALNDSMPDDAEYLASLTPEERAKVLGGSTPNTDDL